MSNPLPTTAAVHPIFLTIKINGTPTTLNKMIAIDACRVRFKTLPLDFLANNPATIDAVSANAINHVGAYDACTPNGLYCTNFK